MINIHQNMYVWMTTLNAEELGLLIRDRAAMETVLSLTTTTVCVSLWSRRIVFRMGTLWV